MADGPACFRQDSSCPAVLRILLALASSFAYRAFTFFGSASHHIRLFFRFSFPAAPSTPYLYGLGSFPFARRYSGNHCCFLLLRVLGCFGSPGPSPFSSKGMASFLLDTGFPHSDTGASSLPYSSAPLFAVRCVLLQSRVARHPPYALASLISCFSFSLCFFEILFFLELFFSLCSIFFSSPHNFTLDLFCCVFLLVFRFSKIDSLLWRTILQNLTGSFQTTPPPCFFLFLLRKEVIHPHVPVGIPCYDLTPVMDPAFDGSLLFQGRAPPASGIAHSHGLTGGVYKARERIHRGMLIRDY